MGKSTLRYPIMERHWKDLCIRPLDESDWLHFRELRLLSLSSSSFFMPLSDEETDATPLEAERAWTPEAWRSLLSSRDTRCFFAAFAAEEIVAISQLKKVEPGIAELKSTFVKETARRSGVWSQMVDIRIDFAKSWSCTSVRIGHRIGHPLMQSAFAKKNFRPLMCEKMTHKYQDGEYGWRIVYERSLHNDHP